MTTEKTDQGRFHWIPTWVKEPVPIGAGLLAFAVVFAMFAYTANQQDEGFDQIKRIIIHKDGGGGADGSPQQGSQRSGGRVLTAPAPTTTRLAGRRRGLSPATTTQAATVVEALEAAVSPATSNPISRSAAP